MASNPPGRLPLKGQMRQYQSKAPAETPDTELARLERGVSVLAEIGPFRPSVELAKAISEQLLRVPGMYAGWADQLYRAAVSVPANIAEAHGRNSLAQRIQYTAIGRGSAWEVLALLLSAPVGQDVEALVDQARDVAVGLDRLVLEMTRERAGGG